MYPLELNLEAIQSEYKSMMTDRAKYTLSLILAVSCMVFPDAEAKAFELLTTMTGEMAGDQFGISVASAGDVNSDGYDDIIVGADANDEAGSSAGKVYIFFGGPAMDSSPDMVILGRAGEFFGVSVSGAGDVNNDGFDDVIVGAHFNSEVASRAGRAAVYFGGSPMDTTADVIMYGENALDYFGISVSQAGDVNHDGYDDAIVGAYKHDSPTLDDVGKVYIYFGGESMDSIPDLTITGMNDGERFGYSVSDAGNVNDDLYDDVVVGAYSYDEGLLINPGRAYVFLGGSPMDTVADVVMSGGSNNEFAGWSVSDAGDVNGDNYDDVIVGAYGYTYGDSMNAGKIYLYHGGSPMDNTPDFVTDVGREQADYFGFSVCGAGDLDLDGYDDLVVGANGDDDNGEDAGKTHIFFGGTSISPEGDIILLGESAEDEFGQCVASAAGLNQDDSSEVIIGAWRWNESTGKVYVYGSIPTDHLCGDCNSSGAIESGDVVYLISYLYRGGPAPSPLCVGDANCSDVVAADDVVYLINYLFRGGLSPCPYCCVE